MNLQNKVFELAEGIRARSFDFANYTLEAGRARAQESLATLSVSGRELNKVVRRHAARFVKENATIVRAAGRDVSAIARDTYASFTNSGAKQQASPTRNSAPSRKRPRARNSA